MDVLFPHAFGELAMSSVNDFQDIRIQLDGDDSIIRVGVRTPGHLPIFRGESPFING